ncbi:carbohydrate kinase family protein [Pararhizobium mangrovi]|uniref:Carbohydrate kinase n=1 Tax=Pararhizobium mangrovi TaxID=2590452 RepID=A0A506U8F3_9HYPH|nr:carbohydrate kinase [Pararhizobium mangrovi]TPW30702.1 carbohydrate kinase [Pararhizobium mangrovi]
MFVSCGDALFDLFALPPETKGRIALEGHVGGSPLNVAVGLARLGNQTGYLAKNSSDTFGQRIAEFLKENGVSSNLLVPTTRNSTLALVSRRADGSADYGFYISETADRSMTLAELPKSLPREVTCVHVGSYSTVTDPTAASLLALVRRERGGRFVSYDPNIRPSIEPDLDRWREQFGNFSAAAHCIKASDEDIAALYPRMSAESFAADRISGGASLVFVTRGPKGAMAFSANGRTAQAEGRPVEVVDTVGAGDTFAAAMLHWLGSAGYLSAENAADADLDAILAFSIAAAAVTCSRRGADLPRLDEIAVHGQGR